jgi:hypothetical protein
MCLFQCIVDSQLVKVEGIPQDRLNLTIEQVLEIHPQDAGLILQGKRQTCRIWVRLELMIIREIR